MRWLHRIGYVTTAIVAIELLVIAAVMLREWREQQDRLADLREQSRTHQQPLQRDSRFEFAQEADLLRFVDPLPAAPASSLRFAAMPSLQDRYFAYSLTLNPGDTRAHGKLVAFAGEDRQHGAIDPEYRIAFSIPAASARRVMAQVGRQAAGWDGEATSCLDGTGVGFEFRNGATTLSGSGNSACSEHYRRLALLALRIVQPLIPGDHRPADGEWRPVSQSSTE